jgi:hypothetical protein
MDWDCVIDSPPLVHPLALFLSGFHQHFRCVHHKRYHERNCNRIVGDYSIFFATVSSYIQMYFDSGSIGQFSQQQFSQIVYSGVSTALWWTMISLGVDLVHT